MININKQINISIDGEDIETLKNIAQLAQRYIDKNRETFNGDPFVGEYQGRELKKIMDLIEEIFDA